MIIRRLLSSSLGLKNINLNPYISRPLYSFSQNISIEVPDKKQLLNQTLKQLNLLSQPSVFMREEDQLQTIKQRTLTQQEKQKLKLFIPKMPLNPRMALQSQLSYRQQLCQNLYQQQTGYLETKVRILQKITDSQHFTIDKYINTVYKDIYARYLVNKGIGVEWKGRYSSYGILNSNSLSPLPTSLIKNFIKANISSIQKVHSIAPYSYLTQNFIPTDLIEVENIRKIGHYIKLPLIQFGKHQNNFKKLQERGSKVEILVFCQFLEKLINPHCLCLTSGSKMIILKRLFAGINDQDGLIRQSTQQASDNGLKYEYLVTSLDIFNKHKEYFANKKYQKHLIFESDHLLGMKAQYCLNLNEGQEIEGINLEVMSQIEGYERDAGIYVVNASTSIPDYERVQQFKAQRATLNQLANVLDAKGKLNFQKSISPNHQNNKNLDQPQNNEQDKQNSLSIIDIEFEQKLLQILKVKLNFEQLYDVFEDQVYSNKHSKEVLRFRLFQKYQIPIKSDSYRILQQYFSTGSQEIFLHQSKVQLPKFKKFNKPRERRLHKKNVRQSLKQRTEYMTLLDSINSINNVPISGSIKGDLKMYLEINHEGKVSQVYDNINEIDPSIRKNVQQITISVDLIEAITFLYNTQHSEDLNLVIVEAQTFTQQILPLCLHLTLFKTKQEKIKRGRKIIQTQHQLTSKLLQSLKMIYLHPTLKPNQRDIDVYNFIVGSLKISNKKEYGFGFEAIRLWVCRHSDQLGDRQIKETQVNQQLKNCAFIRKLYAELIPLVPKSQLSESLNLIQFDQLNFLDRFMHQKIDAYILNMEHFYSRIMLKEAYEYTVDFFTNVVDQIFLTTVRHHIITYPNHKDNLSHGVTARRLIQLLSVIAPLFPFSSYHISKSNIMKWPQIKNSKTFCRNLLEYNALIRIRTQLRNKIEINKFSHCEMIFPVSDTISYTQQDLRKFFGVDKISFVEPNVREKKFGFKLRFNQTLGGRAKISIYESKDHCIRCDPQSKQKEHLCKTCSEYLETNIGQEIEFYDKKNMALPKKDSTINQGKSNEIF